MLGSPCLEKDNGIDPVHSYEFVKLNYSKFDFGAALSFKLSGREKAAIDGMKARSLAG
jgi:hypothetical protein